MTVDTERGPRISGGRWIDRHHGKAWLLGLAVLSGVILGPLGLVYWIAGFLMSAALALLLSCVAFVAWAVLLMAACVRFVRSLRARRKTAAGLWLAVVVGIVIAHVLFWTGKTPYGHGLFARGFITQLELWTDIDALQAWAMSLDPNDCMEDRNHDTPRPGRYLSKEEQPKVLRYLTDNVRLELDAKGRPCVRLSWDQSKAGTFGLVIGDPKMETPVSGPGMYDEQRRELRPGVYFWYRES
ncbi:hypothetical protein [Anaerobaca lacustris]|uniref:Uncharacterized protein n=1 Tax=Anaerobaca lacustris TaxID=3044600 RepID=A0AAW6U072_9BACT|nr:hypothetical protein [Sedimentisphaerales bacterium M17dextr]